MFVTLHTKISGFLFHSQVLYLVQVEKGHIYIRFLLIKFLAMNTEIFFHVTLTDLDIMEL